MDAHAERVADRRRLAGLLFVATMVVWCALPFLLRPFEATDLTPYLVAGELVETHQTEAIYAQGDETVDPVFATTSCRYSDEDCVALPFVSTPQSIPFGVGVHHLSTAAATMLTRVLCALCLVGAMALLWRRVASTSDGAPVHLALGAVLMTPVAVVTLSSGNNTPLLVLLAALPLASTSSRRWDGALGVAVGIAAALKAYPVVFILVALAWRRFRLAAWAVGTLVVLTALTLAVAPASVFTEFVSSSSRWSSSLATGMANASTAAGINELAPTMAPALIWLTRIGVVALGVALHRRLGRDHLWVCALPLALLVWPQVWVAYLFFTFIAVAVIAPLADRLWLLPIVAITTLPAAIAIHGNTYAPLVYSGSLVAGWLVLIVSLPAPALPDAEPSALRSEPVPA